MPLFLTICFFLAVVLSPVAGMGADARKTTSGSPYVGVSTGAYLFSDNEKLKDYPLFGFHLGYDMTGYDITDSILLEAKLSFVRTYHKKDKAEYNSILLRADALYPFLPRNRLMPYIAFGLGGIASASSDGSRGSPLLNVGGGAEYFIKENLAVRGDLRHLMIFDRLKRNNFETSLGMMYYLQTDPKLRRVPAIDSDKDGVPDDRDLCPETPKNVKVDANGCPMDNDGDGVADYLDKCPGTPKGVTVNSKGCPEDSDADGVYDFRDKCPDTPRGTVVDDTGCPPVEKKVPPPEPPKPPPPPEEPAVPLGGKAAVLSPEGDAARRTAALPSPSTALRPLEDPEAKKRGKKAEKLTLPSSEGDAPTIATGASLIMRKNTAACPDIPVSPPPVRRGIRKIIFLFKTNSADVEARYRAPAKKVADFMSTNPQTVMYVEGHADNSGTPSYNMKLSRKRATRVKELFQKLGVKANRITTEGFGCTRPVAENTTAAGKAKNRRVISTVKDKGKSTGKGLVQEKVQERSREPEKPAAAKQQEKGQQKGKGQQKPSAKAPAKGAAKEKGKSP